MPFANEKISDNDRRRLAEVVSYEKLRSQSSFLPMFVLPSSWTIDRARNVYLICVNTGGREAPGFYVLGVNGTVVLFNFEESGQGNLKIGVRRQYRITNLRAPVGLELSSDELRGLVKEAMTEKAFFMPLEDGGTIDKPNTTARRNIVSIDFEFR